MDNTEELIPLLLPDNEDATIWVLRYMTKEEADMTISKAFDTYEYSVTSKEVINNNEQVISELGFNEDLQAYNDSFFKNLTHYDIEQWIPSVFLFLLFIGIVLYFKIREWRWRCY